MSNKSLICLPRTIFVLHKPEKNTNLLHENKVIPGKTLCRLHI
jgi:hypothetical protein